MVTPFDSSGAVDLDVAVQVAKFLESCGNEGLVVAGSTGEGSSLRDEEKLELFRAVASAVTIPVLAGTGSADTAAAVALTRAASTTGVAGILATTPAYVRPSQHGIEAHLGAMASATELPVMLYDIPSRTGRKIAAPTTVALFEGYRNVVAMKDASGDLACAQVYKAALGAKCDLYSGDDALTLPFLGIGAVGVVSVAGHWAAPEFVALIDAHAERDIDAALEMAAVLAPSCVFEGSEAYPNPQPAKAALRYMGLPVGHCRLPLGESDAVLDAEAASVVSALLAGR
jgi:4-hydroxy-tetrahydrodipicolinate synthase